MRSSVAGIDMVKVNEYNDGVIGRLYKGLQGLVKSRNVTYVEGEGRLVSPTTVAVGDQTFTGKHAVLATGSYARTLPGLEISVGGHYDSNSFLVHKDWNEAGLNLSFNLFNLLSGPSQMRLADAGVALADQRRISTQMATLAQVHIALIQYSNALLQLERADGILQVRMHHEGGGASYGYPLHSAWPQLWTDIGNDLDNEVMIFTGTGEKWIAGFDQELAERPLGELPEAGADLHRGAEAEQLGGTMMEKLAELFDEQDQRTPMAAKRATMPSSSRCCADIAAAE